MEKLNEYQDAATKFARYGEALLGCSHFSIRRLYVATELAGEVGELCNILKKSARDQRGFLTPKQRIEIRSEIGDILWALSQIARECSMDLAGIAAENLAKLTLRKIEREQLDAESVTR